MKNGTWLLLCVQEEEARESLDTRTSYFTSYISFPFNAIIFSFNV